MSIWSEIYPWILSGIGGAIGAALLLLPKWGEALIQFRTGKLLEGFKSAQNRELERLKAEQTRELERFKADQSRRLERLKEQLSHLGDRGRRSNEAEFIAVQTVWKAFVKVVDDIKKPVITLPSEVLKMRREHGVPLSRQAVAILAELREPTGWSTIHAAAGADYRRIQGMANAEFREAEAQRALLLRQRQEIQALSLFANPTRGGRPVGMGRCLARVKEPIPHQSR
jgi:integrase